MASLNCRNQMLCGAVANRVSLRSLALQPLPRTCTAPAPPLLQLAFNGMQSCQMRMCAAHAELHPSGAPAGQITPALMQSMQQKISEALQTDQVQVTDVYGDGRHVSISVVSPLFEEKSAVNRQRLVYKAIWLELQEAVHAVEEMETRTPAEAGL